MRKAIAMVLVVAMVFALLTACTGSTTTVNENSNGQVFEEIEQKEIDLTRATTETTGERYSKLVFARMPIPELYPIQPEFRLQGLRLPVYL